MNTITMVDIEIDVNEVHRRLGYQDGTTSASNLSSINPQIVKTYGLTPG